MSIIKKIDRSVIITLDKRINDAYKIQLDAKKLGINANLFISGDGTQEGVRYNRIDVNELPPSLSFSTEYPTWWKFTGAYNCFLAHKEVLRKAKEDDIDYLLLLEDDVIFENDFLEVLGNAENFLENKKWEMLYLGCYHHNSIPTVSPNVMKMNGGGGFHGVILTNRIIRTLEAYPPCGPFDWISGKLVHPFYPCYAVYPSIVSQVSGYSYVEKCNLVKKDRYCI